MKRVVLESPYAAAHGRTVEDNVDYARKCLRDSVRRGEAPIASHLLFPQAFDDAKKEERDTCMAAGHAWIGVAEAVVCYEDYGISPGMIVGVNLAISLGIPVIYRTLDDDN